VLIRVTGSFCDDGSEFLVTVLILETGWLV